MPVICQANNEVDAVLKENTGEHGRKRKPYMKISDELRAKVGKFAAEQGNAAAVCKFSQEFESPLSESMVRSLKKAYLMELRRKREANILDSDDEELGVNSLPPRKRGRPVLLGECMDAKVQAYIKASRDHGCVVNTAETMAAAKGIIKKTNRMLLEENGGPIALTKSWAKGLLY